MSEPRILLHVGAPKTGTSFVQDTLFTHRDQLREQGILYPADRHDAHFLAALDLMELPWGGLEREATGRWDRLAEEARSWPGTVIISHEILGRASRLQAARALESLTGTHQIHVVLSARDLVRQIPAEWQENVKHRRTRTYADFLRAVQEPQRSIEVAQWFWSVQEVPDVLDRWASGLPRERVHLVTVPSPGAPRTLLWERFAGLFGIDPAAVVPTERANASIGTAETTTIRRLNTRLNNVLNGYGYRRFVREIVVHQHLAHRAGSTRLTLPPDVHEWAADLSRSWVSELALRAYDVVGNLDELIPTGSPGLFVDPDGVDDHEVAEVALDAAAVLAIEAARLREVEKELHGVIEDLMGQLDAVHATSLYRTKERLVRLSRHNAVARAAYSAYRRVRGRNSRST